jgi:queuine tRNA-ribosyltransferase
MLSNTYHLALRPGVDTIRKAGGLHSFMNWPHALLTDSGGFQMVSLSDLMEIDEEKVTFTSPYNEGNTMSLTPENSVQIQHSIGSNIVMQLDDVVSSTANDPQRYVEAMERTIRWYDRCKSVHEPREGLQNLFPIIQGGLDRDLRHRCVKQMLERNPPGIAVGGLSGGEEKDKFVEMVAASTDLLPPEKPRYLMGVGFAVDMMLSVAMGCDMFDCVFPTRTARFGFALVGLGTRINLKSGAFASDRRVLDTACDCPVCSRGYSRAYLSFLFKCGDTVGCHLLSQHNLRFQMRFMTMIRDALRRGDFPSFIRHTLRHHYHTPEQYPSWVLNAIRILALEQVLSCPQTADDGLPIDCQH